MSRLFSEMVMASQMGDTVQKKMVYLYLTTYAEQNAELAILAVNTLQKDTKDVDPSVRGLALRSLCSLHLPNMVEYLEPAISAGLSDPSGYVRKTSVMGVLKFNLLTGMPGFVDQLKVMLTTDQDPNVVANCIVVLKEMGELPGLLDQALVYSLVNKFHAFSEWSKCLIIDFSSVGLRSVLTGRDVQPLQRTRSIFGTIGHSCFVRNIQYFSTLDCG